MGARDAARRPNRGGVPHGDRRCGRSPSWRHQPRVVEIHTHVEEGGLSRMERLPELALPEGVGVRLEPGGLHLMLIDLAGPLVAGESLELRLDFAAAGRIDLVVPVLDARASGPDRAPHDHGAHHTP
jgi:copper(I)-binding protein